MATVTIEEKLLSKQNSRNIIRAKLVECGLATSSDMLETLATIVDNIVNRGAVSVSIKEGETYTIPAGYHNGAGTVSGIAGGGDYKLEPTRTVTPTKQQQAVTPASGFYGLEGVTVLAIPEIYHDVSSVTAAAGDVLASKVIVLSDGSIVAGTMVDNGAVTKVLDATTVTYTIPKGYHSGTGKVSITLETKTVTPTKETQSITPSTGKVLSKVTVDPIPDKYQDVSGVTAGEGDVLVGKKIVDAVGNVVDGAMPNNGAVSDNLNCGAEYTIPAGYHDGAGKIIANDLASQTKGTATKGNILSNKSAWVNGQRLLGSMIDNGNVSTELNAGAVYTIPSGYHAGAGLVIAKTLSSQTPATAEAGEILDGETAWVSGKKVEGTMPNNGSISGSVDGITTTSKDIPAGYTSGGSVTFDDTKICEMLDAI